MPNDKVIWASGGFTHTCAVLDTGKVKCFGKVNNAVDGQLQVVELELSIPDPTGSPVDDTDITVEDDSIIYIAIGTASGAVGLILLVGGVYFVRRRRSRMVNLSLQDASYVAFISHMKKETGAIAPVIYDKLHQQFPRQSVFLDVEEAFSLNQLVEAVTDSHVFLVLISPGYLHRPYCVVELIAAFKAKKKLLVINVVTIGTVGFDYGSVRREFDIGGSSYVKSLLDVCAWDVVENSGYDVEDYANALRWLLDFVGMEYRPMDPAELRLATLDLMMKQFIKVASENV